MGHLADVAELLGGENPTHILYQKCSLCMCVCVCVCVCTRTQGSIGVKDTLRREKIGVFSNSICQEVSD